MFFRLYVHILSQMFSSDIRQLLLSLQTGPKIEIKLLNIGDQACKFAIRSSFLLA